MSHVIVMGLKYCEENHLPCIVLRTWNRDIRPYVRHPSKICKLLFLLPLLMLWRLAGTVQRIVARVTAPRRQKTGMATSSSGPDLAKIGKNVVQNVRTKEASISTASSLFTAYDLFIHSFPPPPPPTVCDY